MSYRVTFFKERQKFSAAHFTLFHDGEAERLHGHNYKVSASFSGKALSRGLLFPFHEVKPYVSKLCEAWDERILLPTSSDWVHIQETPTQYEVSIRTPRHEKFYSFPKEDIVLLRCNNVSSENLATLFMDRLVAFLEDLPRGITDVEVTVSESAGQSVTLSRTL